MQLNNPVEPEQHAQPDDKEDLSAFEERAGEPALSYEALLADLKSHGKL